MKLSYDKIVHLSHVLADTVAADDAVEFRVDRNRVRLAIQAVLTEELQREERIEQAVRRKIGSLKRNVPEGSREWDQLFARYYEEEMERLHRTR